MMRRPVRALVLLLTVAVTAGVVWRATQNEQARGRMRLAAQQTDAAAADAIFELADLRATLHAYVAPGQGYEFWAGLAQRQIESLRGRLRDLEPAATAANHPLTAATTSLDALAGHERRARAAMRDAQPLVAGDIIFAEARTALDTAARDLSDARQAMARGESAREAGTANEQSLLAGALIAVWIFALVLLVPVPSATRTAALPEPGAPPESARALSLDREPGAAPPSPVVDATPPAFSEPASTIADAIPALDPRAGASDAKPASAHLPDALPVLQSLAALCAEIGRVGDSSELPSLLERAAGLIGARGVVVWLVGEDRRHLYPALAHGYDQRLLGRMGAIPVDDHNLTAAAYRTQAPARAAATHDTPGAIAVPLVSATGPTGVLAAEVAHETDPDSALALAEVLAAQLSGLFPGETIPK